MRRSLGLCIVVLSLSGGAAGAATVNGFGTVTVTQTASTASLAFRGRLTFAGVAADEATGVLAWTVPEDALSRIRVATTGPATLTIGTGEDAEVYKAAPQTLLDLGGVRVTHGLGSAGPALFGSLYRSLALDRVLPDVGTVDARLWAEGEFAKGAACGDGFGPATCVTYRLSDFDFEDGAPGAQPSEFIVFRIGQTTAEGQSTDGPGHGLIDPMPAPLPNWLVGGVLFGFTAGTVPDFEGRTAVFATEVEFGYGTAVVPLPPALPLLAAGLASLIALRRRAA